MRHVAGRAIVILVGVCGLLSAGIFAFDLLAPRGVAAGVPYVAVVLLSLCGPRPGFALAAGGAVSLLTVLGFFLSPPEGDLWLGLINRGLALFAICTTAIMGFAWKLGDERRARAVREREEALEDVKILRGLLPICAWCKKVRDDRGLWNQIEAYIETHSEAEFTHGVCPECRDRHFPWMIPGTPPRKTKA